MDTLYRKPNGVKSRWASFENPEAAKGAGGKSNRGAKGRAYQMIPGGATFTLLDVAGSGIINRIWMTIRDRDPKMLRSLRVDMFWDGAATPAVSAPLGDFFGVGLGRRVPFQNALFSDPEGRSFNCAIPMPFRTGARITFTNESDKETYLFYDVNFLLDVPHEADMLYFHAHWHREKPNTLGRDYTILPHIIGSGRFLGSNLGVITDPVYSDSWWGEGEVKAFLDGDGEFPTLCGTGTEDYIGTAWGQGAYGHATQGCLVADSEHRQWAFYRYHTVDPIYFDRECRVVIQTIGGAGKEQVIKMQENGGAVIPVTVDANGDLTHLMELPQPVDLTDPSLPNGWCNFYRQDDWSSTAYFYLDRPENGLPKLAAVDERTEGLGELEGAASV